ncbi:MAG TPA: alpha/beta fold hydrolase [Paracoccaceae bacterium]|nr:alpha/beta fold hydrolase [Paracoccaceae bacterium]
MLLPSWLTHLAYQERSTAWRPWLDVLSKGYRLIRYDPRGCGLSDRTVADLSFEAWVADLGLLLDRLELRRVSLVGICQGGAVAIAYAGAHPDRIDRLVLFGSYARGRNRRSAPPMEPDKARVMLEMLRLGWGDADSAFMRAFATQFQPDGGLDHLASWCDLQRRATSPANAVALTRIMFDIDVSDMARRIANPTLILHPERDAVAPIEEGRLLARLIPDARFLPLDSANHFPLPSEPAWAQVVAALADFLPTAPDPGTLPNLSAREREVLTLVAQGLDNHAIGAALGISEKTVRNHVTVLFDKLGVSTRAAAVATARDAGLGAPV